MLESSQAAFILVNQERKITDYAFNTMSYKAEEIERIVDVAFKSALERDKRLCSVDKANVLEVSQLWREIVDKKSSDYPDVKVEHMLVDNAAMQLVREPKQFDVIVSSNLLETFCLIFRRC